MGDTSKIEWCDRTHNEWIGCTKVSPACDHCYAERDMATRLKLVEWGAGKPRHLTSAGNRRKPLQWNARPFFECPECGERSEGKHTIDEDGETGSCHLCFSCGAYMQPTRQRVFSSSLSDWLDNEVDPAWLRGLLDTIRRTPKLDWLLLTKRIGIWRTRLEAALDSMDGWPAVDVHDLGNWISAWLDGHPPANVWVGSTIVTQAEADRDIPKLLQIPARVRFLSMEPLLGDVDLSEALWNFEVCPNCPCPRPDRDRTGLADCCRDPDIGDSLLHWVIAGGESGPKARPSHPDWFRSLRDQCNAAGVAFLFKQWGEWAPGESATSPSTRTEQTASLGDDWSFSSLTPRQSQELHADDEPDVYRLGKKASGRFLDGREHNEFPAVANG